MTDTIPSGFTQKSTPADADEIYFGASPFSGAFERRLTWLQAWTNYFKGKADALYQPLDSDLTAIAALTTTSFGRAFLALADEAAFKAAVNLEIGTDVQAYSANLATYSSIAPSANIQSLLGAANYAGVRALLDLEAGTDFYSISAANAAFQPIDSDLSAIAALTTTAAGRSVLTFSDPNADRLIAWDDSAGSAGPIALADITDLADPATGDYIMVYTAEGALAKVNWSDLPGAGGGISNIVEDTTPQLGGDLDLNGHVITGMVIGTNVQAYNAGLGYLAGLGFTNEATFKAGVNLEIGTDVQAYSANLATFSGIAPSANVQSLLGAANYAAMRTLLDLEAGTDFYSISAADSAFFSRSTANQFAALTAKSSLATTDLIIINDSAASGALKKFDIGQMEADIYSAIAAAGPPDVTDGTTTVSNATQFTFASSDFAVTDGGSNEAQVALGFTVSTFAKTFLDDTDASGVRTTLGLVIGTNVQAYDADALFADVGDNLVAGYTSDSYSGSTVSSGTYTPAPATGQENFQHYTNGGAHTLAPPAAPCSVVVEITNNGSAGAITTSGFTKVSGDSFTTTDTHKFICYITKTNSYSSLYVEALQ